MANVLAVVKFEHVGGLSEDRVMNNFAFLTPSPGIVEAELDAIGASLSQFYSSDVTLTSRNIAHFISEAIDRTLGATVVRFFDLAGHLDGTAHGSPIHEVIIPLGDVTSGQLNLPAEIASACSMHAAYGSTPEFGASTRPRARLRGRVYIGPLTTGTLGFDAPSGRTYLVPTFRDTVAAAAARLGAAAGHAWAIWSRANEALEPIVGGWVDDAYDVQRRRGEDAVDRSLFAVV